MSKPKTEYGNESISSLKGADRVRKRPGVIFGSDGLEGCEHAVFEILSNSIDEAREGYGSEIMGAEFPLNGMTAKNAITGNLSSVSCMRAANIKIMKVKIMNFHLGLMALALAQPNMRQNIWMSR